jgi:type VI secretion system protein ImpA
MSANPYEVEPLIAALRADAPAGDNLEYDPAFLALEQAGAGKPEVEYGDKRYPAEPPDWQTVHEQALALAARTRDLRVAVWLLRAGARLHGLDGAARGLTLLRGMLEGLWDSVHPQLDASDGDDPTMRLSALASLFRPAAAPADLLAASLAPVRGSLTLRELALGLGAIDPASGEVVPTEAGVLQALQGLLATHEALAGTAEAAQRDARAIVALLEARLGRDRAPDAAPLTRLVDLLAQAVARVRAPQAADVDRGAAAGPAGAAAAPAAAAVGGIASRDDAVRAIGRICDWIERHEPSNPAPLLLRRAQRLMNKSFLDIVRDLAPNGVDQVEMLAGRPDEA